MGLFSDEEINFAEDFLKDRSKAEFKDILKGIHFGFKEYGKDKKFWERKKFEEWATVRSDMNHPSGIKSNFRMGEYLHTAIYTGAILGLTRYQPRVLFRNATFF